MSTGKKVLIEESVTGATTKKKTATEPIECDACKWLQMNLRPFLTSLLSEAEKKTIRNAQAANWKILKGARYVNEKGNYNGQPYESNYIPKIHAICQRYGLYSTTELKAN